MEDAVTEAQEKRMNDLAKQCGVEFLHNRIQPKGSYAGNYFRKGYRAAILDAQAEIVELTGDKNVLQLIIEQQKKEINTLEGTNEFLLTDCEKVRDIAHSLEKQLASQKQAAQGLVDELMQTDYNSVRELLALMAEGEGEDSETYRNMAKAALTKLKNALAQYRKTLEGV
jgi:chromosome segregation ATPase